VSSAFTYEPSSPGQLWALPRSPIRFFKALGWPHESPQHIRPRSSCGSHLGQPPDTEAASCSLPFWIPLATGHKSNYVSNWFNNIQQHLTYLYIYNIKNVIEHIVCKHRDGQLWHYWLLTLMTETSASIPRHVAEVTVDILPPVLHSAVKKSNGQWWGQFSIFKGLLSVHNFQK